MVLHLPVELAGVSERESEQTDSTPSVPTGRVGSARAGGSLCRVHIRYPVTSVRPSNRVATTNPPRVRWAADSGWVHCSRPFPPRLILRFVVRIRHCTRSSCRKSTGPRSRRPPRLQSSGPLKELPGELGEWWEPR